ncbi:metallophosphoesterase family protein [Paenibacillus enshidis]|uniref:Metallophosphoesterase family protein n=1 Tax=Paenibacillus enshidis TaxID=1458439 RepID=A0ABV5AU48_9BACL
MKLVLMGDLHYHDADGNVQEWAEARERFYEAVLDRFLELEGDAHIALGDLTNFGTPTELEDVYERIRSHNRTFYHVLGNHDVYGQPKRDVLGFTGQAGYHAVMTDEVLLVFLDTTREMDCEDWSGWMDDEQLHWLLEMVKLSGSKPLLVFAHHPVYDTTAGSMADKGSIHPDVDLWDILSQKEGTGLYFNGHTHVDSIVRRERWTFVQLSACLDSPSFRTVHIEPEEIRVAAVDMNEPELREHAAVLHSHMKHFSPTPGACGAEADRACIVTIATPPASVQPL